MIQIVIPVFLVILVGYLFGRRNTFSSEAEKLINDYVLFIALPALLFLAVARADPADLTQWEFALAVLGGVAAAYIAGVLFARARGTSMPQASLVGMSSCYGTTGYMGIPILIAGFGAKAAVPAAIATILHNIPAIMTVIVTHDVAMQRQSGVLLSAGRALATTLKNPLTLAVLAGTLFSILRIPLPDIVVSFAQFLANAAGPTALFALGLGLARIAINRQKIVDRAGWVLPVVIFKILLQPIITFTILVALVGRETDIWFATAIVMAAQPIGAGAYVFANKYGYFNEDTSAAIIVSLLLTVFTITALLQILVG